MTQGAKFAEVQQQDCDRRDRQATITDMKRFSNRRDEFRLAVDMFEVQ